MDDLDDVTFDLEPQSSKELLDALLTLRKTLDVKFAFTNIYDSLFQI